MKKENTYYALKILQIIRVILLIVMCIMVISFSIIGHCASDQDYFPMQQDENQLIPQGVINVLNNRLDAENYYIFVRINLYNSNYYSYYWVRLPKTANAMMFAEIHNDLIHFSLYNYGPDTSGYQNGRITLNRSDLSIASFDTYNQNAFTNFTNQVSSNYDTSKAYISNFLLQSNSTSSARIVLMYDDGVTVPDGDTARDDMEKPDIDNYIPSWTNRPTFDGSSVENALSSIWDITIWTAENTRDTIKGVGEFVGDTIRWTSQKIIDSIRGKIDEIKTSIVNAINGIKTLVTNISNAIDYIKEPLDTTTLQATITNSTAFGDVSTITGSFADFKAVFDSTSEPNEYKIPLHLENVSILGQTQAQYIDLSIIANQRTLIRAFCWVVTTFSLFVTVVDALPNYLKGGDE